MNLFHSGLCNNAGYNIQEKICRNKKKFNHAQNLRNYKGILGSKSIKKLVFL